MARTGRVCKCLAASLLLKLLGELEWKAKEKRKDDEEKGERREKGWKETDEKRELQKRKEEKRKNNIKKTEKEEREEGRKEEREGGRKERRKGGRKAVRKEGGKAGSSYLHWRPFNTEYVEWDNISFLSTPQSYTAKLTVKIVEQNGTLNSLYSEERGGFLLYVFHCYFA